jgi:lipoyl-dependent peroxiredoxin subunit D
MSQLESLRGELPEVAKDIRLNLQAVLQDNALTEAQRWGVAVAAAAASRNERLRRAVMADAEAAVGGAVVDDGLAAAVLMAMNNVYYRFRHAIEKDSYTTRPARLRMTRIARPATNKLDFELYCFAVSAINNCQACLRSHEKAVVDGGISEDAVHDAVRIAATVNAAALALELGG